VPALRPSMTVEEGRGADRKPNSPPGLAVDDVGFDVRLAV